MSGSRRDASEWLADAWGSWAARHPVLVRRLRRAYIAWSWLSLAVLLLMLLLVPSTRRGFAVVLWMYYVLVQFWLLCRSKTLTWRVYSLAFSAGLVLAPLIGLLENVIAAALGWPMPDERATVWVAGPVEETLKLLPLAGVFVLARRRARRLAVVDHVLLAAAGGAAFQYVEDAIRRLVYRPSLLSILLGGDNTATQYAPLSLFPGWFESLDGQRFAGHAVTSALIGAGIGLAVHLRPRLGRRVYVLPFALWLTQSLAHTLYNAAAVGQEGIVPWWLRALYVLWGSGSLERPLLVVLLLAALAVDYEALRAVADRLPALPPDGLAQPVAARAAGLGRRLTDAPPADAAPVVEDLARAAGAAAAGLGVAAGQAWHELLLTWSAARRGPAAWFAALLALRQRRELGMALARASAPPRPPGDQQGTSQRVVQLKALLAAAGAMVALGVLIATVGAGAGAVGDPAFLAGLFDSLAEWWNGLEGWQKALVLFGLFALLFWGFGLAFSPALNWVLWSELIATHGEGVAAFLRDPVGATRDFLRNVTPTEALVIAFALLLQQAPGGRSAANAAARRAADAAAEAADPESAPAPPWSGLQDYTGPGYREINAYLRNPGSFPESEQVALQARADAVSADLAALPPVPGTSYRGARLPAEVLAEYELGEVVTEDGFLSTTSDPTRTFGGTTGGNVVFTVLGQTGRDVSQYSQFPQQAEILFDSGTRFRVLSRTWDEARQVWRITMEEVVP